MKKRVLALLLAMLMVCALLPVSALAEEEEPAAELELSAEEIAEEPLEAEEELAEEVAGDELEALEIEEPADEEPVDELAEEPAAEEPVEEEALEEELAEEEELDLDGADGEKAATYNETKTFDKAYITIVDISGNKPLGFDPNTASTLTVSGTAGSRTATIGKGMSITVTVSGGNATLSMDDPPGTPNYMYVTSDGTFSNTSTAGGYQHWAFDSNGQLYYDVDGTHYYFSAINGKTSTMSTTPNTNIIVFSGTETSNSGSGSSNKSTTDAEAPVFSEQPSGAKFVVAANAGKYTFEIKAERTIVTDDEEAEESEEEEEAEAETTTEDITYQWYLNGEKQEGKTETSFEYDFTGKPEGVYTAYCEATYTDEDETAHTTKSKEAAYIIAVEQTTDFIMFSDIHEETDNIADVLTGYMKENNNKLPQIVIATGDYCNSDKTDDNLATQLDAVDAMLGGLDTIYLAGNHEDEALVNERNNDAWGAETGHVYDKGVHVYVINYDAIRKNNDDYKQTIEDVGTFLAGLDDDLPVLFVAHAGIHMTDSSYKGGASYNVDYSDQMVDLLNKYGKTKNIFFFFGHNHSKISTEFYWTAGQTITSTYEYTDSSTSRNRTQTLNFTYGPMGYLNTSINGSDSATVMKFNEDNITIQRVGKDGYIADTLKTIPGKGGLEVPVVGALQESAKVGDKLTVTVTEDAAEKEAPAAQDGASKSKDESKDPTKKSDSKYEYQWYRLGSPDTSAEATEIDHATKSSYTVKDADDGMYVYCKVTLKGTENFATTTAVKIGETKVDDSFKPGDYVIVLDLDGTTKAVVCNEDGSLSVKAVTVKDGKVVGPVDDEYLWNVTAKDAGTIKNIGTDLILNRASAKDGGSATINAKSSSSSTWTYDAAHNMLYNASTGGNASYYYPSMEDGEFVMGKMSSVGAGDVKIYLLKVGADGEAATPNTNSHIPPTGDNSLSTLWALLALSLGVGAIGITKKKFN